VAYGDRRRYVVALLTLDGDAASAWARAHGIENPSLPGLAAHPGVLAEVSAAVDAANARLARVQQVKRWRLLPAEWTAESEELTPTLKLKRRIIHAKYAGIFDELYAEDAAGRTDAPAAEVAASTHRGGSGGLGPPG
jgi:long-chain acyl-CoA synthetase